MRFISALLCLCFTLNVFAATPILSDAFDNYNYALTVEWDQKDDAFKAQATEIFFAQIEALKKSGLSNAEISAFIDSKVQNQEIVTSLKTELTKLAQTATSEAELAHLLSLQSSNFYAQGANWSGRSVLHTGIIVAISALFVYGVYFNIKYGCIQEENGVRSYCTDDDTY